MKRRDSLSLLGFAFASLVLPNETEAQPRLSGFHLSLQDLNGYPLRTFWHAGTRWVLGRTGQAYQIQVTNPTPYRVEVVLSVDGRDVISGRPGNFTKERGYVLSPYGSVRVRGFRRSLTNVAQFRFTDPSDAYSARMGTPQHVGIIGAAFFAERAPQRPPIAVRRSRAPSSSAPKRGGRAAQESRKSKSPPPHDAAEGAGNLGTQYGETTHSPVSEVSFERLHPYRPDQMLTLRYDDADGLRARGVLYTPTPHPPEAFPESRFAPPPP